MTKPNAVLAAPAVVEAVPPCATDNGVVNPVREVISLLAPEAAALNAVLAAPADVAPVPPDDMGRAEPRVNEVA